MGIAYQFPPMVQAPNSKDLLVAMMSAFHEQYPDQGLLLVVDELLDYLRSRHDQALVLDLTFLRELGEACRLTRFRFMAGIQESLFDSPRFQFVADSVRRVKDRFEQVRIAREDVAYVVAERLLRKDAKQRGWIREHLQRFTPLYGTMAERMDEFVRLFPVHPAYLDVFERVYVAEKREVLKTLSAEMQDRLESDVPADEPGLIAYDTYWDRLRENPSFRSIPEIKEVIDKSQVLEDRVRNAYTRPQYRPAALRIIHALSVHRLTTGDIYAPLGATAEELRDGLCLYLPVPERDADFLKTTVETTLREIMRTVSGQFISFNPENGQYYLDLKKDIDFDAQIEQRAESLETGQLDRYYFEALVRVMECPEATYVPGYRIWQHEVEWRERRVTRPGYLFFGAPNQRSTAQPPREFYLYMLQPYEPPPFTDERKADEVFFRLARRDEEFETALKLYAGAREMAGSASGGNKLQYERKAGDHLKSLQRWLRENLPQAMDVTYKGVTQPFIEWVKGGAAPQATKSVRDLVNAVASTCLSTHFAEELPDYPAFSILITQATRAQAAQEAVRWLAGGLKTRQGAAVLDALDLLDDGQVQGPWDSRYAGYFLQQLTHKGEGQVLNRSELIGGAFEAEVDHHFKLEPEWVAVVLLGLVYTGEISLALPGRKLDAGNLEEAIKIGIADLANWKFIERPKGLPLAALTELFQLLELPTGLIKDTNQHTSAVEQLQKRVAEELDRLVMARQKVQDGLPVWNTHVLEGQARADLLRRLDGHKGFLESLQTYNTPGKLRNFRYSAEEVKAQAAGRALRADVEALADVVSAIQPLAAYLGVAMAVLPAEHEWPSQVVALQEEQLARLRTPKQWRQPHLRSSLTRRWRTSRANTSSCTWICTAALGSTRPKTSARRAAERSAPEAAHGAVQHRVSAGGRPGKVPAAVEQAAPLLRRRRLGPQGATHLPPLRLPSGGGARVSTGPGPPRRAGEPAGGFARGLDPGPAGQPLHASHPGEPGPDVGRPASPAPVVPECRQAAGQGELRVRGHGARGADRPGAGGRATGGHSGRADQGRDALHGAGPAVSLPRLCGRADQGQGSQQGADCG